MRIGIISDSHGRVERVELALTKMGKIDALLHAGDYGLGVREIEYPCPVYFVQGNCDVDLHIPYEQLITLAGKRIYLTHGHQYDVKSRLHRLELAAREKEADIVVFGHTHQAYQETANGILFLNPGSLSRPRDSRGATFGIIEIEGDKTAALVMPLLEGENQFFI